MDVYKYKNGSILLMGVEFQPSSGGEIFRYEDPDISDKYFVTDLHPYAPGSQVIQSNMIWETSDGLLVVKAESTGKCYGHIQLDVRRGNP